MSSDVFAMSLVIVLIDLHVRLITFCKAEESRASSVLLSSRRESPRERLEEEGGLAGAVEFLSEVLEGPVSNLEMVLAKAVFSVLAVVPFRFDMIVSRTKSV